MSHEHPILNYHRLDYEHISENRKRVRLVSRGDRVYDWAVDACRLLQRTSRTAAVKVVGLVSEVYNVIRTFWYGRS